jgi:hypothetical protein
MLNQFLEGFAVWAESGTSRSSRGAGGSEDVDRSGTRISTLVCAVGGTDGLEVFDSGAWTMPPVLVPFSVRPECPAQPDSSMAKIMRLAAREMFMSLQD